MTVKHDLGYLLDHLCDHTNGISHALVVSGDGLKIATSRNLPADKADQLSAFTSGMSSLASGTARLMGSGQVEQNTTEMTDCYVIIMAIDDKSVLTVWAAKNCDLGQVAYEAAMLTNRVSGVVTPDVRQPLRA